MKRNIIKILIITTLAFGSVEVFAAKGQDENRVVESLATPTVTCGVGSITIYNPLDETVFTIYSIIGQPIKSFTMPMGTATVELPKGFYIIKCNLWSRKIVVK